MNNNSYISPEEVTKKGQDIYFGRLQKELEPQHNGEYVVIEVESGKHFMDPDVLVAINEARKEFPNTLFFIAPIGQIQKPSTNYQYAWHV